MNRKPVTVALVAAINADFPDASESRNNLLFLADRVNIALSDKRKPTERVRADLLAVVADCGRYFPAVKAALRGACAAQGRADVASA